MPVVGGIRGRLIHESLYRLVETMLRDLGWFATGRQNQPIVLVPRPVEANDEVAVNTLAVSAEDTSSEDLELGSLLSRDATQFWIDFYAESDAVGAHLIGDVREGLRGKISAIGRTAPVLDVYDWRLATPVILFRCEIADVVVDRAHEFTKAHLRHWYSCRLEIQDDVD